MKTIILAGVAALALAGCANDYVSSEQQACIANTLVAVQSDPAAADLRLAQKAALIADACSVSVDAILLKAAE